MRSFNHIHELRTENLDLHKQLEAINNMGWFDRLTFFLTGTRYTVEKNVKGDLPLDQLLVLLNKYSQMAENNREMITDKKNASAFYKNTKRGCKSKIADKVVNDLENLLHNDVINSQGYQ